MAKVDWDKFFQGVESKLVGARADFEDEEIQTGMNLQGMDLEDVQKRSKAVTLIVRTFAENYAVDNREQRGRKKIFYWFILVGFSILNLAAIALAFISVVRDATNVGIAAAMLTSLGTMITSMIVLPGIIAKHLFPEDERDKSVEMIGKIFEGDLNMRKFYKSNQEATDWYNELTSEEREAIRLLLNSKKRDLKR